MVTMFVDLLQYLTDLKNNPVIATVFIGLIVHWIIVGGKYIFRLFQALSVDSEKARISGNWNMYRLRKVNREIQRIDIRVWRSCFKGSYLASFHYSGITSGTIIGRVEFNNNIVTLIFDKRNKYAAPFFITINNHGISELDGYRVGVLSGALVDGSRPYCSKVFLSRDEVPEEMARKQLGVHSSIVVSNHNGSILPI